MMIMMNDVNFGDDERQLSMNCPEITTDNIMPMRCVCWRSHGHLIIQ